jgi:hypothetical protein
MGESYFLFEARIDFRTESASHQLGTETNAYRWPSRLQAHTNQSKLGLQERITVLLLDSDGPAQDNEQIGSRRLDHIQVIDTDVDIAHVMSRFDERGFE